MPYPPLSLREGTSDENTNDMDYPVLGIDYLDLPESDFAWRLYRDHDPLLCVLRFEYEDSIVFRVFPRRQD